MNNKLFREKNIERVSSPEQLQDRIRVANPGVWLFLVGVILVLAGICVWGIFGRMDTLLPVAAITEDGQTVCYVKEADIGRIDGGMAVRVEEEEYGIREISLRPVQVDASFPDYLCHVGELSVGEWVYEVRLAGASGTDGSIFRADIVIESIAPLSFVVN